MQEQLAHSHPSDALLSPPRPPFLLLDARILFLVYFLQLQRFPQWGGGGNVNNLAQGSSAAVLVSIFSCLQSISKLFSLIALSAIIKYYDYIAEMCDDLWPISLVGFQQAETKLQENC